MVTLVEHVEESEDQDLESEKKNCQGMLHQQSWPPCSLNMLVGDPLDSENKTKEITVARGKPFFLSIHP